MLNGLVNDFRYDEQMIQDDLNRDLDENHEWYEKMSYVEKPESLKREHAAIDERLKGTFIDNLPTPLKNYVIVKIEVEKKSSSGLLLATNKKESNFAVVKSIHKDETDFKLEDRVVIELNKEKGRFNVNGIHLVLHKKFILGILD